MTGSEWFSDYQYWDSDGLIEEQLRSLIEWSW